MDDCFRRKLLSALLSASIITSSMTTFASIGYKDVNALIKAENIAGAEKLIWTEESCTGTESITISIDEDDELRDFNKNIMGMQCEVMEYGDNFFNRYTNQFSDGYLAMADKLYEIPTARWGGTTTNFVNLVNNIGPLESRKDSVFVASDGGNKVGDYAHEPVDMGPVEFIKSIQAVNPNASFMFVIPLYVQTPEETVNFTRFLLDDKDESEWGALRASYGIEKPVNLLGYELGNENYFRAEPDRVNADYSKMTATAKEDYEISKEYIDGRDEAIKNYCDRALLHLNAVHQAYPEVKLYPCVDGNPLRVSTDPWNRAIAKNFANVDGFGGVAYHAYYAAMGEGLGTDEWQLSVLQNIFTEETGAPTKVAHTEHAIWSSNEQVRRESLEAALAESSFITRMQYRSDIVSANYHTICANGSTWGFFYRTGKKYYEMGVNKVYKLYQQNWGNKVVNYYSIVDELPWKTDQLVTKAPNGDLIVTLSNFMPDKKLTVNFTCKDEYDLIKKSVFTAPNLASYVMNDNTENVFSLTTTYENEKNVSSVTMPAKSLVVLTLAKPGTYEEHTAGEVIPDESESPTVKKDENSADTFVKNGEPENVIYIGRNTITNNKNIYHIPTASAIRKLVNVGDENATVYVSRDDYSYKKLADLAPGESFINTLTDMKYSYVKLDGCQDVVIYTDLNDNDVYVAEKDYGKISAKVGGSTENITYTSSNRNVAIIEDGYFVPLRNGTTTITATNGIESISKTVNVKAFTEYFEDFQSYEKDVTFKTPLGFAVRKIPIFGDWALSQQKKTINNNPTVKATTNGMVISAAAGVSPTSNSVAYCRYEGDMSALTENYNIEVNYTKGSVLAGIIVKFHMHNEDNNYYMLVISGKNAEMKTWSFYKIVDKQVVYQQHGEDITGYTTNKTGPLHSSGVINISVEGNKISWTIDGKRYNNIKYSGGGSYVDEEPFMIAPRNTTFGFSCNGDSASRNITIKSVKITGDTSDKTILQSPINDDLYVDVSSYSGTPALLFKGEQEGISKFNMVEDTVGDGFIKVPKVLYENKYSKMYLWDMSTLKPLQSIFNLYK